MRLIYILSKRVSIFAHLSIEIFAHLSVSIFCHLSVNISNNLSTNIPPKPISKIHPPLTPILSLQTTFLPNISNPLLILPQPKLTMRRLQCFWTIKLILLLETV
jgi:hypothetical protein